MTTDHHEIRREYLGKTLRRSELAPDPHEQFASWLDAALADELMDATAMSLATVDASGQPSVRIVLLKAHGQEGFVFYSDSRSQKGRDLAGNPRAELMFYWREHNRQVRVSGAIERLPREAAETYFRSRPIASQQSAAASEQSAEIKDRASLEAKVAALDEDTLVCPEAWCGFRLIAERFEFWQGRENRLHDRFRYGREGSGWLVTRLQP